jgi:hypothetical protein
VKPKPPWADAQALKGLAKRLGLDRPASSYAEKLGKLGLKSSQLENLGLKSSLPGSAWSWFYERREREFERLAFEEHRKRLEAEEVQRRQRRNPQIFAGANAHLIDEVQRQLRNHASGFRSKKAATNRAIEILKRHGPIAVGSRKITIGDTQFRTVQDEIVTPIWQELPKPVRR